MHGMQQCTGACGQAVSAWFSSSLLIGKVLAKI